VGAVDGNRFDMGARYRLAIPEYLPVDRHRIRHLIGRCWGFFFTASADQDEADQDDQRDETGDYTWHNQLII
jgi:hypothetical protein